MAIYVGDVVKDLLNQSGASKPRTVTVLGLAFKENVPDLRNTKVVDVIRKLESDGITVQVHDPVASTEEAHREYGMQLISRDALTPANAVVVAVAHRAYTEGGWKMVRGMLKSGAAIVVDVKGVLPGLGAAAGCRYWRL